MPHSRGNKDTEKDIVTTPPTTPRQRIFNKLKDLLEGARVALQKESEERDFEDLDAILLLARTTAEALQKYNVRRELLVKIYAALVKHPVDLSKLDVNWDVQGTLPSLQFSRLLGEIAVGVANRLPIDESPIEDPFEGEKTTCIGLRAAFRERCKTIGVHSAAEAFAAV